MLKFLRKHLTGVGGDPAAEPLVTCTTKQLRNAITYALAKVQPARVDAEFRRAYAARGAFARDDVVPGMACLSISGRVDQVRMAHHRLTLAAGASADLALDLLTGKADAAPVPAYARPITNLTDDGSYVLSTAAGFRHPIAPATHPASDDFSWPEVDPDGLQFGATELRQAFEVFQQWSELNRARKPEQHWEADFDEGLTEAEWDAVHGRRAA
jgi:hypothetical protein